MAKHANANTFPMVAGFRAVLLKISASAAAWLPPAEREAPP